MLAIACDQTQILELFNILFLFLSLDSLIIENGMCSEFIERLPVGEIGALL